MEQRNDRLDPISDHASNNIVIVINTLFVYRSVSEWEESRPGDSRISSQTRREFWITPTKRMMERSMELPN